MLKPRVLIVEDEAPIRFILQDALQDSGYDVVEAATADCAFAKLSEIAETICGLITDIDLGKGGNGWDVAHRARELNHHLAVVYITGASAHDWASKGVPNSTIISKPFAINQIAVGLSTLINQMSSLK